MHQDVSASNSLIFRITQSHSCGIGLRGVEATGEALRRAMMRFLGLGPASFSKSPSRNRKLPSQIDATYSKRPYYSVIIYSSLESAILVHILHTRTHTHTSHSFHVAQPTLSFLLDVSDALGSSGIWQAALPHSGLQNSLNIKICQNYLMLLCDTVTSIMTIVQIFQILHDSSLTTLGSIHFRVSGVEQATSGECNRMQSVWPVGIHLELVKTCQTSVFTIYIYIPKLSSIKIEWQTFEVNNSPSAAARSGTHI